MSPVSTYYHDVRPLLSRFNYQCYYGLILTLARRMEGGAIGAGI
jgi:hypothetical protein